MGDRSKYSTLCMPNCTDTVPHQAPEKCTDQRSFKAPRVEPTRVAPPVKPIDTEQDAIDLVNSTALSTIKWDPQTQHVFVIDRTVETASGQMIIGELLPEWLDSFLEKNADYGDNAFELGAAGQFSDIWRKIGKLRKVLWEGGTLTGEQPDEILDDLIGHCFLTKIMLREGNMR